MEDVCQFRLRVGSPTAKVLSGVPIEVVPAHPTLRMGHARQNDDSRRESRERGRPQRREKQVGQQKVAQMIRPKLDVVTIDRLDLRAIHHACI